MKTLTTLSLLLVLLAGCSGKSESNPDANLGGTVEPGPGGNGSGSGGNQETNANPNGPLWVVLSNFRDVRNPNSGGLSSGFSVDYRVVSGRRKGSYVIRLKRDLGAGLSQVVDIDVPSGGHGTIKGAVQVGVLTRNTVAVFGEKGYGADSFKAFSGELGRRKSPTSAQPPSTPSNKAGGQPPSTPSNSAGAGTGKVFALSNPRQDSAPGGGLIIDYRIVGRLGVGPYLWAIKGPSGRTMRKALVSSAGYRPGMRTGTLKGGLASFSGNYQMWIERTTGRSAIPGRGSATVVSNVVTGVTSQRGRNNGTPVPPRRIPPPSKSNGRPAGATTGTDIKTCTEVYREIVNTGRRIKIAKFKGGYQRRLPSVASRSFLAEYQTLGRRVATLPASIRFRFSKPKTGLVSLLVARTPADFTKAENKHATDLSDLKKLLKAKYGTAITID
jgi:hypothetical protein